MSNMFFSKNDDSSSKPRSAQKGRTRHSIHRRHSVPPTNESAISVTSTISNNFPEGSHFKTAADMVRSNHLVISADVQLSESSSRVASKIIRAVQMGSRIWNTFKPKDQEKMKREWKVTASVEPRLASLRQLKELNDSVGQDINSWVHLTRRHQESSSYLDAVPEDREVHQSIPTARPQGHQTKVRRGPTVAASTGKVNGRRHHRDSGVHLPEDSSPSTARPSPRSGHHTSSSKSTPTPSIPDRHDPIPESPRHTSSGASHSSASTIKLQPAQSTSATVHRKHSSHKPVKDSLQPHRSKPKAEHLTRGKRKKHRTEHPPSQAPQQITHRRRRKHTEKLKLDLPAEEPTLSQSQRADRVRRKMEHSPDRSTRGSERPSSHRGGGSVTSSAPSLPIPRGTQTYTPNNIPQAPPRASRSSASSFKSNGQLVGKRAESVRRGYEDRPPSILSSDRGSSIPEDPHPGGLSIGSNGSGSFSDQAGARREALPLRGQESPSRRPSGDEKGKDRAVESENSWVFKEAQASQQDFAAPPPLETRSPLQKRGHRRRRIDQTGQIHIPVKRGTSRVRLERQRPPVYQEEGSRRKGILQVASNINKMVRDTMLMPNLALEQGARKRFPKMYPE